MSSSDDTNSVTSRAVGWLVFAVALVLTVVSFSIWAPPPQAETTKTARYEKPHQRPHAEFATSDSCRSCHPGEYSTWHDSYHRTMAQIATPEAVAAPFDDVLLNDGALSCRLEQRGDEFWATVYETNWREKFINAGINPESVIGTSRSPFLTRKIEMTTGSHHMQVFWVSNGGRMMELPFYYHIDGQRWIPRDDSVLAPPQPLDAGVSTAEWRLDCIKCHSLGGNPGMSKFSTSLESSVAEFGISCEACHGPAKKHIEHHRSPLNRYKRHLTDAGDPTIVNPARLTHVKSAEICGQCHISFLPRDTDNFLQNGLTYRAGGDFSDSHVMQEFTEEDKDAGGLTTYWADGTCCVGGDEYLGLVKSACYLRGEMTCISCHSMHQSDPSDQLAKHMEGDHACLQCHQSKSRDIEAHTHHRSASSGSRCYNCHMPHTTYALFTAMRSHRVDNPSAATSIDSGRPNACNLCHLDQTLKWTAQHLNDWYGTEIPEMQEDEKNIAASLLWLLRGNAVQRLITAWHFGYEPAQTASETGWSAPFLAQILEDPYSMVRYVAHRALSRQPGFEGFRFDYIAPHPVRIDAHRDALKLWAGENTDRSANAKLLLDEHGLPNRSEMTRLLQQRDDTPIVISE